MALYVPPGDEDKALAVAIPAGAAEAAELLGCARVERWPWSYQLDSVAGPSGEQYRFDVWVDEEGALHDRSYNACATLAAHPLNEAYGRTIAGPALLVPLDGTKPLTLDAWREICQGVWYDASTVRRNVAGQTAAELRAGRAPSRYW
jgi:hypothetical protein